jgi:hypothetical protein
MANTGLLAAAAAAAAALALAPPASAASRIPPPRPPQNPHLAANPGSNIHNDTWMTDAYRQPGPTGRDPVTALGALPPSLCSAMSFDRQGHIVTVCPSAVAPPVMRVVDPRTLAVLAEHVLPNAASPPGTPVYQDFTGGGYFFLDEEDRLWVATKTRHVLVLAISPDGRTITQEEDYDLTGALRPDERINSALPDFDGRIWFVTKANGAVGVLDPETRRIRVHRTGEQIVNSFTVDRDAVYVVTDRRLYRFSAGRDGRPRVDWRSGYRNSGITKPSQVSAGSGTTPTILPGGYVAITDNADPMDVVVYRKADRLRRGASRVVCEVPVFEQGGSATENSLIGSGRTLIVENNFGYQDPFGPQAGNITETGFARVDVRRGGRGCVKRWTNRTVRAPSVVPKLSAATQLVYTYEQTLGAGTQTWSWVGIDARTGRTRFTVPAGSGLTANNNYAGIALGPDGTAYLGTIGGIRSLRDGPAG